MISSITEIKGYLIKLINDNIDTDRIIPARFMKEITFEKLGDYCFYDERFEGVIKKENHPFNYISNKYNYILLTGKNFGCGSSREHAPQSLKRAGVKAIIAESFAEIFFGNATTIGLPCVVLTNSEIEEINKETENKSNVECVIDIANKCVNIGNKSYYFKMPDDVRNSFLNGTYDSLSILIKNLNLIKEFEKQVPYKII